MTNRPFTANDDIHVRSLVCFPFRLSVAKLQVFKSVGVVKKHSMLWLCTCAESKPTENPESIRKQNDGRS